MGSPVQDKMQMQLKGIGKSLTVRLDPTKPLDDLKEELKNIFNPLKHLSANAHIVIDAGDEQDHEELVRELGAILKDDFKVGTVTGPFRRQASAKERVRHREMDASLSYRHSDVLMMTGLVRSGQKITARKHFLLLGDLNPGGEVIAGGDVLILGSLRGKAIAGYPDNENALILAMDFRPTQIQIGRVVAAGVSLSKGKTTEFAQLQNGAIVVADYLKSNPFGAVPWPEIR